MLARISLRKEKIQQEESELTIGNGISSSLYAFLESLYKGSHSSFSHLSCMSSLLSMKEELDVGAKQHSQYDLVLPS